MKTVKSKSKTVATNRRASYDYAIIDTWEAGIKLNGLEVKGLRAGNSSIAEAWVKMTDKGAILIGATIPSKQVAAWQVYDPTRDRNLLLHKRELKKIRLALQRGLTVIPLRIYFNSRGLAKVAIATAKGKKKYDKRQTIKDRDLKRYGY